MGDLSLVASALGLGFVAGFRLYLTVLVLGLAMRFNILPFSAQLGSLHVLADTRILAAAAVLAAIEFFADKVPWIDSIWDSVHTVVRPLGAAILGSAAASGLDPALRLLVMLLTGGVALSGHSSKAATRLAVNNSPEPASNIALSVAEDALAPLGIWLSLQHPFVMLAFVAAFLGLFGWLSPKILRLVKLEWTALGSSLGRVFGGRKSAGAIMPDAYAATPVARVFKPLAGRMRKAEDGAPVLRSAAGKDVGGLRNSIGYLRFDPDRVAFLTRRGFRKRTVEIPLSELGDVSFRRGILLDRLTFTTANGDRTFYLFKSAEEGV
ncbi:MAG: DUF4126 domain-containing protein [Acidobacteriota bacterium]